MNTSAAQQEQQPKKEAQSTEGQGRQSKQTQCSLCPQVTHEIAMNQHQTTTSVELQTESTSDRELFLTQRFDDLTQSRQRLVNLLGLLEGLTLGACLADLLTTGKVNKVQLPGLLGAFGVLLVDLHDEDTVTA